MACKQRTAKKSKHAFYTWKIFAAALATVFWSSATALIGVCLECFVCFCWLSARSATFPIFLFLADACPRRSALQSATTTQKGRFHVRGNQQKDSQLAITMNELIKQIPKQISPPRKSASKTGDAFRSRVINGAREKEHRRKTSGSRYLTRGAFDHREGSTDDIKYHKSTNSTVRNVLWNTDHGVYTCAGKLESASNLTNPGLGQTAWNGQAKREHRVSNIRSCFSFAALFVSLAAWEQSFDAIVCCFNFYTHMDCQYPRDPQPETEKKNCLVSVRFLFYSRISCCFNMLYHSFSHFGNCRLDTHGMDPKKGELKPCSRRSSEELSCDESSAIDLTFLFKGCKWS